MCMELVKIPYLNWWPCCPAYASLADSAVVWRQGEREILAAWRAADHQLFVRGKPAVPRHLYNTDRVVSVITNPRNYA
jgi:hypothetical protein